MVSSFVELGQDVEGGGDVGVGLFEIFGQFPEGMKRFIPVAKEKKRLIGEAEEIPSQCGENRELVVRPFNRGQGVSHGLDFFPEVKSPASHEHVRDVPGLESVDIRLRDDTIAGYESPE
jgi:hypothetical protein